MEAMAWLFLSTVGLAATLRFLFSFLASLYRHFVRRPKDLARCYGSWALVTGATDGIGRSIAFHLAAGGLSLVLVARNPAKLDAVSREIRAAHGVDVRTLVMDLAAEEFPRGVTRIREAVAGLDLGVVVNNAGTTYPTAMYLHEVAEELRRTIVGVNLRGVTMVTRAVLPGMIQRGRGAVVCVGSGAANALPSYPLYDVYAATKAYIHQLCASLHVEYERFGINVQCQVPMYVATKMVAAHKRTSFFVPTADEYARSAVRWIGYERQCLPHWTHALQFWLISLVPDVVLNAVQLRIGLGRRRRFMKQLIAEHRRIAFSTSESLEDYKVPM